ncbi:MAG TPA: zinc-binding dehydrogenase [Acidimicrobiia bacterium]|nr:zinc-binding dehydrogenase [Acidimicrobiia bacterium]
MATGRAALFFEPGKPMTLTEFPVVDPAPGSVLVRVTRANVCGSDLHFWRGDGRLGRWNRQDGAIIGHEMTGVVHALGDGVVTDFAGAPLAVGDRVVYQYFAPCGRCRACLRGMTPACPAALGRMFTDPHQPPHFNGAFADYYHVSPRMALFKVPDTVTDTMVAGANCALAQVIYGLERIGVGFGDTVVIQGAGGLGAYATAVAKERGAHQVIVIDGLDDRLALARAMGADATVDLREHARPEDRVAAVRTLTNGWGADVVCELVGFSEVIPEGLRMLAVGGRYLEIGTFYPGHSIDLDPGRLVAANHRIEAVMLYDAASLGAAVDFLARNAGRLPLDQVLADYPLDQINEAFLDQLSNRSTRASIVMT